MCVFVCMCVCAPACSCENLTFHTIGFGPADFVWLRKMAAAVKGKFHE